SGARNDKGYQGPLSSCAADCYIAYMNQIFPPPVARSPTQAAEGLPRWRWTVAEIERIAAAGFFSEYDRFELIGGGVVAVVPKRPRPERLPLQPAPPLSRMG